MLKSHRQQIVEASRGGRDIRDIVPEVFEQFRCRTNIVLLVAAELGVSDTAVYKWCREFGIDIDDYRRPATEQTVNA